MKKRIPPPDIPKERLQQTSLNIDREAYEALDDYGTLLSRAEKQADPKSRKISLGRLLSAAIIEYLVAREFWPRK